MIRATHLAFRSFSLFLGATVTNIDVDMAVVRRGRSDRPVDWVKCGTNQGRCDSSQLSKLAVSAMDLDPSLFAYSVFSRTLFGLRLCKCRFFVVLLK